MDESGVALVRRMRQDQKEIDAVWEIYFLKLKEDSRLKPPLILIEYYSNICHKH